MPRVSGIAALALALSLPLRSATVAADAPAPRSSPLAAPIEVANYDLDVQLDDAHRVIDGTATIRWTNMSSRPATELWWHLYMNAFENARTLFMRTGGAGGHRGNKPGQGGQIELRELRLASGEDLLAGATHDPDVADDNTQLRTPLPQAVPPGAEIVLRVSFRTTLPAPFARTGHWNGFAFAGQWFPKLAVLETDGRWAHFPFHAFTEFYADFGRYDVRVTVPQGDIVGACGEQVGAVEHLPRGDRHHFVAAGVHDFAFTAWAHFRERIDTRLPGTRIRLLFPPGLESVADRSDEALHRAIPIFARRYGAYPYSTLTVVIPPDEAPGIGGMEYPTLITADGMWLEPRWEHYIEWVAIHEFAHQYFYGLLANDEWSWPFLDEGLAEYSTGLAMQEIYGPGRELADGFGVGIGFWSVQSAFSGMIRSPAPVAQRSSAFTDFMSYSTHVYRRAATILRTAETAFDRDGTDAAMRLYADRSRFRHPTPADLLAAFTDTMGSEFVAQYLQPALFGDASVDFTVERLDSSRVANATGAEQFAGRAVIRRSGGREIPVIVQLESSSGDIARVRWDGRGTSFTAPYHGATALRVARVDPDVRVSLDANRLDNARAIDGAEGSLTPLTARFAFWVGLVLRAVGP